ncbi:glycine C-acetyltransferase [bacterium]|nr:glycine C-acetyltransferase [bacterium]
MSTFLAGIAAELAAIRAAGTFKAERVIDGRQGTVIMVKGREVLNFCANNYLGLANHPRVVAAAKAGLEKWGYGMSSVRFICGTQRVHKELEARLAAFLGLEDSILYVACFDANGGLYEPLLGAEDAIFTASLNHASIIDGIRLCKAKRHIWPHDDLGALESSLQAARATGARRLLIATDGVFSMDGDLAPIADLLALANRFEALLMVDDSHATGLVGPTGRGTPEAAGVHGRVHLVTSTLGKALGGANGGFTAGPAEVIELLRQRSRPYLFSNTLAPAVAAASIAVLDILEGEGSPLGQLRRNTAHFRQGMEAAGLIVRPGTHPITPIMLHSAKLASRFADLLLEEGIYVIGFSYPVVPKGAARIRAQLSAAHTPEQVDKAVAAFAKVGNDLGIIGLSAEELAAWEDPA